MKKHRKGESGEVMMEGMIVVVVTLIMLVWILGIFFLYYQKYTVRIVTNDVAKKIAATYDVPGTDVIMGYITVDELMGRRLYLDSGVDQANSGRADSYVKYMLDQTNFNGTIKEINVSVTSQKDAMGRSHIGVTTECTLKPPFAEGLEWVGMSGEYTYRVTSYADSTSLTDYVSTVSTAKAFTEGHIVKGPGVIGSTVKMINSFMGMFGQLSADNPEVPGSSGGGFR